MDKNNQEITLMGSEEKYRLLINSMEQGVALHKIITDQKGEPIDYIILEVNPAYEKLTGLKKENIINKRVLDVLPNLEKYWIDTYGQVARTMKPVHVDNYAKDLDKYYDVTAYSPKEGYFAVILSDITSRKKIENELIEKTSLLNAQINSSIDGILVVDFEGKKIIQNQRCIDLWKIPKDIADINDDSKQLEYVKNRTVDPEKFIEKTKYLYSHPTEVSKDEIEFKDGMILERYSAPVISKEGNNYGSIWIFHDITEHKKTEELFKQEKVVSETIIDSIPGTFYVIDKNGKYARWNSFQRDIIVGKQEDQVANTNASDTIHPDDRALVQSKIANILSGAASESVEGRVLLKGGPEFIWMLMTGQRLMIKGDPFLVGTGIDITERKKAEGELKAKYEEMEKFYKLTIDRELSMAELKKEIEVLKAKLADKNIV